MEHVTLVCINGKYYKSGVDMGGLASLVSEDLTTGYMMIKWPPTTCWQGRGMSRSYVPAHTEVIMITDNDKINYRGEKMINGKVVLAFDNVKNSKKEV